MNTLDTNLVRALRAVNDGIEAGRTGRELKAFVLGRLMVSMRPAEAKQACVLLGLVDAEKFNG
jgi:hypothetical protein